MRTITYTVGVDSITPSTVQFGGFAGEDRATAIGFALSDDLLTECISYGEKISVMLEVVNNSGEYDAYPIVLQSDDWEYLQNLSFTIPKEITGLGGRVTMQLSIIELYDNLNTKRKLYTYPIKLRFSPSTSGGVEGSVEGERYHTDVLSAMVRAELAADKCKDIQKQLDNAEDYSIKAERYAVGGTNTEEGEETDNAKYYCEKSSEFADAAESAKSDAETAKSEAESAKTAAEAAKSEAEFAEAMAHAFANGLEGYEEIVSAREHSENAYNSAVAAESAKSAAENAAILAKRYAVGGTGTVEGEDLDNAKAYYEYTKGASEAIVRAKIDAEAAASRAESAMIAVAGEWEKYKEVVLETSVIEFSEQAENFGDTTKGVRLKIVLPANTTLPNNRLTAYINLNNNRRIDVRGEGWTRSNTATVCYFDIRPYDDVWNAEVVPYAKTISGITGDLTYSVGDKVRYVKLQTNETNPIPAGAKIEIWGLQ